MGLGDIEAYTYQADLWCPPCIDDALRPDFMDRGTTEAVLWFVAAQHGIDRDNESTFDTRDFPKVTLGQGLNDVDYDHCGQCGDCLGHDLSDCETEDDEDHD